MAILAVFSSSAFAGGSVNKKDKAYGDCLVNAPKLCGGWAAAAGNPEKEAAFRKCTETENMKCYKEYTK